jgi:hypothetical protein
LPITTQAAPAIVEQTTAEFRHDREQLSTTVRKRLRDALDRSYAILREDPRGFFSKLQRPLQIHLKGGLTSSLCSMRLDRDFRIILAVDDDPVFGQTLVTLFRVVAHDQLEPAYRSLAQALYRDQLVRRNGTR